MSYYKHHVFFCTNIRADGSAACGQHDALAMRNYMKAQCKARGLIGEGGARISTAGCMDRCELGPVMVIYPQATWYTYVDQEDIDEIIESHLVSDQVVERLLIK